MNKNLKNYYCELNKILQMYKINTTDRDIYVANLSDDMAQLYVDSEKAIKNLKAYKETYLKASRESINRLHEIANEFKSNTKLF